MSKEINVVLTYDGTFEIRVDVRLYFVCKDESGNETNQSVAYHRVQTCTGIC
jgi:hypothetical protein